MATIIEGALWTLTDEAAERMEANGLIVKCDKDDHIIKHLVDNDGEEILEIDKPIYHRALDAPGWFGFATMHQAILSAEAHSNLAGTSETDKTDGSS